MGVEVLTKEQAEQREKDRKAGSKKIKDMLEKTTKRKNIQLAKLGEELAGKNNLIDYVKSLISNIEIIKKFNLVGKILTNELSSKHDIDEYIRKNNILKSPGKSVIKGGSILDEISDEFDTKLYYLYINNKLICKEKTIPKIKSTLKESYKNPVTDEKGFLISFTIDNKYKYPLMINCTSYTITPKLLMKTTDDDASQTFVYTNDDLKNYGFNESHLFKIMKALKDESISFESNTVSISEVLSSSKEPVKSKIKGVIKDIQKSNITNLIKDIEKPKPKDKARKTVSKAMDLADKMIKRKPSSKINTHKSSEKVIDAIFDVLSHKPMSKMKEHKSSDALIDTIFEVMQHKLPKGEKFDFTEGDEIIKKIKNKINNIIPTPANASETQKINTLAKSIQTNPEFDNLNREKLEKYSFNIVYNFNEKYHNLMLKLFKTEEGIEKLLRKKTDNILKRKISEKKAVARKIKYAEAGKAKRAEAKAIKQKMVNELSPEEKKKYDQARNYYMRKSKTSTILPKNLNKDDPEALKFVCVGLATKGFDTMSEQLFMKELEE
jgi:hypothetical protein